MTVYDNRRCELGEGAFWHPERQQFFWFDILAGKLLSQQDGQTISWDFDEFASAAGWVSQDELIVASETALWKLNLVTKTRDRLVPLSADRPDIRSNDGRADPWGGFWIGTMGKKAEHEAGSIWRYYKGEMRELFPKISITNAICFDASREIAYFSDTKLGRVWTQRLDAANGWPVGSPELYLDLKDEGLSPDGAVTDAEGNFWNAQWGASRVACYAPDGSFKGAEMFDASQISCPAFGGADLDILFATSALQGMDEAARAAEPQGGMVFQRKLSVRGVAEPKVILG
ncbi:SMP-30/gluconolactonase/LRE family protein [Rhizobium sp. RU36D]|uniref:SMP-30/gluconolactonase/LRE family protein n=1 Tax=Rhizobium sp. RU36D TaxID=1907415 RepID=UPI0009D8E3D6|nr:SMP-30/gluconolactonase/LRE family protein [Rhizobium sp. RU36D]SMD01216.1 Sugar lactone lactonase YvrE [Rhizobium sp. RU36D]